MNYNINLGGWNSIFAVPSDVVDKYIKIASGSNIKVLLYFLRHCGELLNDEIIATALSMNEEDVKDALTFWVQVGLLTMSDGVYSPMQAVPETARPQERDLRADIFARVVAHQPQRRMNRRARLNWCIQRIGRQRVLFVQRHGKKDARLLHASPPFLRCIVPCSLPSVNSECGRKL